MGVLPCDLSRLPQRRDWVTASLLEASRARWGHAERLWSRRVNCGYRGIQTTVTWAWGTGDAPRLEGRPGPALLQVQAWRTAVSPQKGLFLFCTAWDQL